MRRPSLADSRVDRLAHAPRARRRRRATAACATPVGARYSPNTLRSVPPHSPVVTPALAQRDRRLHDVAAFLGGALQIGERGLDGLVVALGAPGLEALDLLGLHGRIDDHDGAFAGRQRRRLGLRPLVDADDDLIAGLDAGAAAPVLLSTRRRFM